MFQEPCSQSFANGSSMCILYGGDAVNVARQLWHPLTIYIDSRALLYYVSML